MVVHMLFKQHTKKNKKEPEEYGTLLAKKKKKNEGNQGKNVRNQWPRDRVSLLKPSISEPVTSKSFRVTNQLSEGEKTIVL